ncbi:MAG: hypothetical protein R3F17_09010 [Planctomycetota bacterium]
MAGAEVFDGLAHLTVLVAVDPIERKREGEPDAEERHLGKLRLQQRGDVFDADDLPIAPPRLAQTAARRSMGMPPIQDREGRRAMPTDWIIREKSRATTGWMAKISVITGKATAPALAGRPGDERAEHHRDRHARPLGAERGWQLPSLHRR